MTDRKIFIFSSIGYIILLLINIHANFSLAIGNSFLTILLFTVLLKREHVDIFAGEVKTRVLALLQLAFKCKN